MNNRVILDLCGGTGAWSKPYADNGYDVRNITLPDYDVRTYTPPEKVYGILAAPPCTEFSLAKGNLPRDFESSMLIVESCLKIIWSCRFKNKLAFWCMENPKGFLRQFLGNPPLSARYWEFGDGMDKPTDFWGYFNKPKKTYTQPPGLLRDWNKVKAIQGINGKNRSAVRAITPPGFAKAFFEANK